jgi:hypothetical protein
LNLRIGVNGESVGECCNASQIHMNHSLLTADRATHLKIVAVALVAAILVVSIGITAHLMSAETTAAVRSSGPVLRAGKPATYTDRDAPFIR